VPTTATISPSNLNTYSSTTEEASNADSGTAFTPGVIAGMAAIVIVGVVLVLGVLGILNYRIKVRRKAREQEQSMNDVAADPAGDEIPIMAEPHVSQPVNERTWDVASRCIFGSRPGCRGSNATSTCHWPSFSRKTSWIQRSSDGC
jgi:hypothetical protein